MVYGRYDALVFFGGYKRTYDWGALLHAKPANGFVCLPGIGHLCHFSQVSFCRSRMIQLYGSFVVIFVFFLEDYFPTILALTSDQRAMVLTVYFTLVFVLKWVPNHIVRPPFCAHDANMDFLAKRDQSNSLVGGLEHFLFSHILGC